MSPVEVFIQDNGTALAGNMYKLVCNVTTIEGVLSSPTVRWVNQSDGEVIQNGINGDITVGPPEILKGTTLLPLLFTVLRAQYSGEYTCQATLPLLPLNEPLVVNASHALDVQSKLAYHNGLSLSHLLLVLVWNYYTVKCKFCSISLQHSILM